MSGPARAEERPLSRSRPPAPVAFALAAVTLLLIGYGLAVRPPQAKPAAAATSAGFHDVQLYRDELAFARDPSSWYAQAVAEQRRMHYPLRPFVAVRPPWLAFALAALPGETARRLGLAALALAVLAVWTMRLLTVLGPVGAALGGLAMAAGLVAAFAENAYLMHEAWAGVLIALSLGLYPAVGASRRNVRLGLSLAAGLAAAVIRELALPYLMAMAAMALIEGRRREALAWAGAVGVVALGLMAHASMLAPHILPSDIGAEWVRGGGWSFLLATGAWTGITALFPASLPILMPPALVGSLGWDGPVGRRLALILWGYAAGFMLIGRPEDAYWGLMLAPLLPLGWVGSASLVLRPKIRSQARLSCA